MEAVVYNTRMYRQKLLHARILFQHLLVTNVTSTIKHLRENEIESPTLKAKPVKTQSRTLELWP